MILLRISLRILIGFYKDFTNFYGFVKKMVQKNQYTYNVPPGPSDYIYNEARRAEFCIRKRIFEFQKGRWNIRILKILKPIRMLVTSFDNIYKRLHI